MSYIKSLLIPLGLAMFLVACAPVPTSEPTKAPIPPVTATAILPTATVIPAPTLTRTPTVVPTPDLAKIKASIQKSLDLYARAYTNNDADALAQAVDPAPPFWRFVTTRYDNFQKSSSAGKTMFGYTVQDIKLRDFGIVEARVVSRTGNEGYWLFREQEGKWLLAEPSGEQLGEPITIERDKFVFIIYRWADDINPRIIALMENARKRVFNILHQVPNDKTTVRIKPIYGVSPYDDPFAVAYYSSGLRGQDNNIDIFSPHSYGYGLYNPQAGWEDDLESILTHEYTHMVHRRSFGLVGYTCGWPSEGLAEYVAESYRKTEVRNAVRSGVIIPLVDMENPVYKQDLNHMTTLNKDKSLAYGFAVSLVVFITQNYGGLDGFWKVASACEKTTDFDTALKQSLGVPLTTFDKQWREFLKTY